MIYEQIKTVGEAQPNDDISTESFLKRMHQFVQYSNPRD